MNNNHGGQLSIQPCEASAVVAVDKVLQANDEFERVDEVDKRDTVAKGKVNRNVFICDYS